MLRFALFVTYDTRNNVEVINMSDSIEDLVKIEDAIDEINLHLKGNDRDEPDCKVKEIIDEHLSGIDIIDDTTGYVHEIDPVGIYELKQVDRIITVMCAKCKKVLFEGSEKERDRIIIYCTDCA